MENYLEIKFKGLGKSPLGLRVTDYEEQIGADAVEHGLAGQNVARYHIEKPISNKSVFIVLKKQLYFINYGEFE